MFKIVNHMLAGAEFMPARHSGGVITPEIVILHDTAGRLERGNSARYLADNDAETSAHFVVERDGSITQLVKTDHQANHAGQSSWHGREWCNRFSIGIEIVNPGKMVRVGGGAVLQARAWWKQTFAAGDTLEGGHVCDLVEMSTPEHGAGVWMDYTPEQISAVTLLLEVLFRDISTLRDITTHWYVSPGRKVDTNPLFPLAQIRAKVLGRDDPAEVEAEARSNHSGGHVRISAQGGLNLRRWPSFNPNVILSIPDNAVVPVLRHGAFGGRDWLRVLYGGQEGWIVKSYTKSAD